MKTKLFTLLFSLLLGNMTFGQGAATPELAWDNSATGNQYDFWFELDVDSDGSTWISKRANARTLPFNTGLTGLTVNPIPVNHPQLSYDREIFIQLFGISGYMSLVTSPPATAPPYLGGIGYEEWYVIRVPSTGNLNINVDLTGNSTFAQYGTTIQWYEIDKTSDLTAIQRFPNGPDPSIKGSLEYSSNGNVLNFNLVNGSISKQYVLLRIGNNDFASPNNIPVPPFFPWITSYTLTVSTNNNTCENALRVPLTTTPFSNTTNSATKELLNDTDEILDAYYTGNPHPNLVGDDDIDLSSGKTGSAGMWFKVSDYPSALPSALYFGACGSSYDPQLLIFRNGCPESPETDADRIVGAEDQNADIGTDSDPLSDQNERIVCLDAQNNLDIPVMVLDPTSGAGGVDADSLYIYLFGPSASDEGLFNMYFMETLGGILPVEWLNFSGQSMGNANRLDWSTATETQNDYFNLEKSADGIHYEILAQIPGQGDAIFQNDYSVIDENPYYQTYYRISQVDYDGTVNDGPQTVVINPTKKVFIYFLSNPVEDGKIKLRYRSDREQEVLFSLTGTDGKTVRSQFIALIEGATEFSIPIPDLAPGMYILSATLNNERWVEKVVVR